MKLLLLYRHHRRTLGGLWRDVMRWRFGEENVMSIGPWYEGEPFGTRGQEPDAHLPYMDQRLTYEWSEVAALLPPEWRPDLTILIGLGDRFRVWSIPGPWAHFDQEGSDTAWSLPLTPSRFVAIRRPDQERVRWLPNGLPITPERQIDFVRRDYDFMMFATQREARKATWAALGERKDLNIVAGEIWGPLYWDGMARAATTYVCAGQDFVTFRTFEAMAMGCLLFADRTPAMDELFTPHEHYIPFVPVPHPGDNEPSPDPAWLVDAVAEWARNPARLPLIRRAHALVRQEHTLVRRAEMLLSAAFKDWGLTQWPR